MTRRNGLLPSLATATLLMLGFIAVWYLCCSWGFTLLASAYPTGRWTENVQVMKAGKPLINHKHTNGSSRLTDLEGNEIGQNITLDVLPGTSLLGSRPVTSSREARDWSRRIVSIGDEQPEPTYWYFMHDGKIAGHGYFEGFDPETKRSVGFLSRIGFSNAKPSVNDQFNIDGTRIDTQGTSYTTITVVRGLGPNQPSNSSTTSEWGRIPGWLVYISSGSTLHEVDLRKRAVSSRDFVDTILAVGKIDRVVTDSISQSGPLSTKEEIILRMTDKLITLSDFQNEPREYTLPDAANSFRGYMRVFLMPQDELLLVGREVEQDSRFRVILQTTASGHVQMKHRKLEHRDSVQDERARAFQSIATSPVVPMAVAWTVFTRPAYFQRYDLVPNYAAGFSKTWAGAWPMLLVMGATSILSAVLIYRHQRKFAAPRSAAWVAFGALFGLPGWFGYRFHRPWPTFDCCTSCGRATPQDRVECAHCGVESPEPVLHGTEVFA